MKLSQVPPWLEPSLETPKVFCLRALGTSVVTSFEECRGET